MAGVTAVPGQPPPGLPMTSPGPAQPGTERAALGTRKDQSQPWPRERAVPAETGSRVASPERPAELPSPTRRRDPTVVPTARSRDRRSEEPSVRCLPVYRRRWLRPHGAPWARPPFPSVLGPPPLLAHSAR